MQFDFSGSRVLVTGGTRGIGAAAARAFLDAGARVAVNGRSANPEAAEREIVGYALLKRIAQPQEVAPAVLYLASPAARFATETTLQRDGGTTAGH